jgi:hypothetical protein
MPKFQAFTLAGEAGAGTRAGSKMFVSAGNRSAVPV